MKATLITLCFILAIDSPINILKNLLLDAVLNFSLLLALIPYLDSNKYSNVVEYINWVLSELSVWSAQNAESQWSHVYITLKVEHINFTHFIESLGYSSISCLVQVASRYKGYKYLSCTFSFSEKATNLFNATGHHACSHTHNKIFIDILLPGAKFRPIISATTKSRNDFNLFLLLVCGGCVLSISHCRPCILTHISISTTSNFCMPIRLLRLLSCDFCQ